MTAKELGQGLIVTVSVPVSQEPVDVIAEAVTVGEPVATSVASPDVVVENVSSDVLLEVQVALFVTLLLLLSVAVNCTVLVVDKLNGLAGLEVTISAPAAPPEELPVMVPLTPASVAVMVTLDAVPAAVTSPVVLTVTHELELDQPADLVTSLEPLL